MRENAVSGGLGAGSGWQGKVRDGAELPSDQPPIDGGHRSSRCIGRPVAAKSLPRAEP
ncbi:MAG: hypothetical protein K0U98_00525 [Deltaproteobacteria bacterium]|nr:hypothetical protein [Deltaproteobacteria bacterium]